MSSISNSSSSSSVSNNSSKNLSNNPTSASGNGQPNQPAVGSNQFYRLKVEDALSYLDQVKFQFERQPEVYNQFLDIMKEFKSQTIDTPGVISRVSNLFRGHTDLIEGFNTFLPPGYKIEVQANDSVHYTAPNSTLSTLVQPINNNINPIKSNYISNNNSTIRKNPEQTFKLESNNGVTNNNFAANTNYKTDSVKILTPNNSTSLAIQQQPSSNSLTSKQIFSSRSSPPLISSQQLSANNAQINNGNQIQSQVEFGHAINYVNKIKSRFHNQPDIYKSFLEILHTYQKQQKNLKDGLPSNSHNYLSETEVYEKVAKLFKNQEDLLIEFSQFLPDANNSTNNFSNYQTSSVQSQQQLQHQILINDLSGTASYLSGANQTTFTNNNNQQQIIQTNLNSIPVLQSAIGMTIPIPNTSVLTSFSINNNEKTPSSSQTASIAALSASPITLSSASDTPLLNSSTTTVLSQHSAPVSSAENVMNQIKSLTVLNNNETSNIETIKVNLKEEKQLPSSSNKQNLEEPSFRSSSKIIENDENISENFSQNQNNTKAQALSRPTSPMNQFPLLRPNKRSTNFQQICSKKLKTSLVTNSSNINTTTVNSIKVQRQNIGLKNNAINNNNITNFKASYKIQNNQHSSIYSSKYNEVPINEITFFEKLKKSFKTQQVYDNFLKCLSLFNREVVTRHELIALVEPFLSKFPNLFRWFKDYVENRPLNMLPPSTSLNAFFNNSEQIPSMEIDYLSCKQHGASYRDVSSYPTSISSGQTELCKQVLNATYVSFPSWSEDSTFISSKKNQYEESIFRIEDERFELDNILETNQSTIKVLENIQAKINKMSQEEIGNFRLTNTLGGYSEIIHIRAIQRVYTDRSKDFIEGLKRNPAIAVPLVLKRLKAKDEEWREAKKNLEKQWREQTEKNYLKSLDHCAVPFKQNDQKHLKTKSLVNEIENLYYERQEAKGEQPPIVSSLLGGLNTNIDGNICFNTTGIIQHNHPHLCFKYEDKSILEDAAALLIHHVKRQTTIQKEDKQKIKQIINHFLSDFFFVSRGALSDDESSPEQLPTSNLFNPNNLDEENLLLGNKKLRSTNNIQHSDTNKNKKKTELTDSLKDSFSSELDEFKIIHEDMYRLFYVDEHWYLFFRYHQILCERLQKIYNYTQIAANQESADVKSRENSVAEALKLRHKNESPIEEYYSKFLEIVRNLLDGNMDGPVYEDTLREMFGIHAYIAFTLDKVVHNCVRQLQYLVQDDCSISVKQIYIEEQRNNNLNNMLSVTGSLSMSNLSSNISCNINSNNIDPNSINNISGCGGKVSNMSYSTVMNAELMYQKKVETLLNDQNCYKILSYKNSCRLTIELIDTQNDEDEEDNDVEIEKWSEYIENHISLEEQKCSKKFSNDLKDALLKNPVFLTRNAHVLKRKFKINKTNNQLRNYNNNNNSVNKYESKLVENNDTLNEMNIQKAKLISEESNDNGKKTEINDEFKSDEIITSNINLSLIPFKAKYNTNNTVYMYRPNTLKNAKKRHQSVTKSMYANFKKYSNKWLKDNSISHECLDDWFLGEHIEPYVKTICTKESIVKKPPYHVYFRYKIIYDYTIKPSECSS